jgi:hypothetical protein
MKLIPALLAGGCLLAMSAASLSIGLVKSTGEFRVDGSAVRGNSNVFEGNLIETAATRSVIQVAGAQITLAPDSRARIFRDHTVLEKGTGSVKDGAQHVIEAKTLHIAPSNSASEVQIAISGNSRVIVASAGGAADVRNAAGILAAHVLPGMSLAFQPQAAAPTVVRMTGTLTASKGSYLLTDDTTKVTVQVENADASKYVGKKVDLTGTFVASATPAGGASQVVRATTIQPVNAKRKAAAAGASAAGAGAAGAAGSGAGAAVGISTAATVAIVGGVAVAGTVGGLAAAGSFSDDTPVSRQ